MKKIVNIALMALVAVFIYSCGGSGKTDSNASTTPKYESQVAKFKIAFPGTPTEAKDAVDTEAGTFDMYSYVYESGTSTYMVAYVEYPAAMLEGADPEFTLNNAKDGFVGKLGMTVEKEEKAKENGNHTVTVRAKSAEGFVVLKDVLVGSKLYQIAIMNTAAYATDEEVKSFIGSFEAL